MRAMTAGTRRIRPSVTPSRGRWPALLTLLGVALAACGGDDGTGPDTPLLPADTLAAAASAPAPEAIADAAFDVRTTDFATNDPALPGVPRSFNTVLVALRPDATVGAVNTTLRALGAEIVGGVRGKAGQAGGLLLLRLPSRNHAEAAPLLAQLRAAPWLTVAAKDQLLGLTRHPPRLSSGRVLGQWQYEASPAGGNWGLEAIRVPQMWGLNPAVEKRGGRARLLVLDAEFDLDHPELRLAAGQFIGPPARPGSHGNHVAGIAAAPHADGGGIEGVTPFAELFFSGINQPVTAVGTSSFARDLIGALRTALEAQPALQVVNVSLGYNWYLASPARRASTDVEAQRVADEHGLLLVEFLSALEAAGKSLPVIVAAAGNDSERSNGIVEPARYDSPLCNAAQRTAVIVCVEGTQQRQSSGSDVVPYNFSSSGGQVSAPGNAVLSFNTRDYEAQSGTSMAAPHVAGLVAYLYALRPTTPRPTLASNPVRDLLVNTGREVAGVAPQVDAFAFVLGSDSAFGAGVVRTALLDIDDGSPDGNQRQDRLGVATPSADLDSDGGIGDGRVTMRDFRRFRDWLLQVESDPGLLLDGAPDSPKRDVNGDGRVQGPAEENIYPMGDFNGDGILSRTATARVGGIAPGADRTDLDVFRLGFNDPDAPATPLAALLSSGDVHVQLDNCVATGTNRATSQLRAVGGTVTESRTHPLAEREFVYTVPVASGAPATAYELRTDIGPPGGAPLVRVTSTVQVTLGGDLWERPNCLRILTTALPGGTLNQPYAATLEAVGGSGTYEWRVSSGVLPAGLTLAPSGQLTGTPTQVGTFNVTISATSGVGVNTVSQPFAILVGGGQIVNIATTSLPRGGVGLAYSATLSATGGSGAYTWTQTGLPAGLTLAPSGSISGTPTIPGNALVTFRATESGGAFATTQLALPVLGITTASLGIRVPPSPPVPPGCSTQPIYQEVSILALGGGATYTFALVSGTLPAGMTLSASGLLSGSVPQFGAGSSQIRVSVTSGGLTVERTITLNYAEFC